MSAKSKIKNEEIIATIRDNIDASRDQAQARFETQQRQIAATLLRKLAQGKFKVCSASGRRSGWITVVFWAWGNPEDDYLKALLSGFEIVTIERDNYKDSGFNLFGIGWHRRHILIKSKSVAHPDTAEEPLPLEQRRPDFSVPTPLWHEVER